MKDLEKNEITDQKILEIFISKKMNIVKACRTGQKWMDTHPNIYHYLLNKYVDSISICEILYRIKNNINEIPKCPICGNPTHFVSFTHGYHKYCSYACATKGSIDKIKQTKLEKYGNENYVNIEKRKQTNLLKYGAEHAIGTSEVREKIKLTTFLHYGVENNLQSSIIRQKIQNTCLEKYGAIAPNTYGSDMYNKTIKEKYGVDNISQLQSVKNKVKNTMLTKYGIDNAFNLPEVRQKCSSKEARIKSILTKFVKGNLKSSKVEKDFLDYLSKNFQNDYEYQYMSKQYPYACDFYIKSLDLYIEIQGSWTHGGHPYNENDINDINRVNIMKQKNTAYYDNAIYTWTIRDVQKRECANRNHLNYLEIYSKHIEDCIYALNNYIINVKDT